jgi:hypothetical protein
MFDATVQRHLPLRKGWPARIRSSTVQAISLANFSLTFARGVAANSIDRRMRLQAEVDRLRQEVALLPAIRKRGNLAFGAEDAIEGGGVVPRGGRRGPAARAQRADDRELATQRRRETRGFRTRAKGSFSWYQRKALISSRTSMPGKSATSSSTKAPSRPGLKG